MRRLRILVRPPIGFVLSCPPQAFEGLDREGKGFLTAEGVKQVVGLDFDTEEVGRDTQHGADGAAELPALLVPPSS